jgi:uncharacterized membrane protein
MPEAYWVITSDGKEYGPAPLDTLSQWVRQRRIIPSTRIRRGTESVTEAGSIPEIAAMFSAPAAGITNPPAGAAALPDEFRVWGFIGQAWDLVKEHWLILGGMFFIQAAIMSPPFVGTWGRLVLQAILSGPIMLGIWRALLGLIEGRKPTIGMMFEGFDRFNDAFLAWLVTCALTFLGFLCFIVPGIILAILWSFTFAILAEKRIGFWQAMQESMDLTRGYRGRIFLLWLAGIPVALLGLLALVVGVFVAEAVIFTAAALAYRFLQQRKGQTAPA